MGFDIPPNRVRMLADKSPGRSGSSVLKNQSHFANVCHDGEVSLFGDEAGRRIDHGRAYLAGHYRISRSGPLPTCTIVTSFPGVKPIFFRAKRAMESVAEPKRLIASVPPFSCSGVLRP